MSEPLIDDDGSSARDAHRRATGSRTAARPGGGGGRGRAPDQPRGAEPRVVLRPSGGGRCPSGALAGRLGFLAVGPSLGAARRSRRSRGSSARPASSAVPPAMTRPARAPNASQIQPSMRAADRRGAQEDQPVQREHPAVHARVAAELEHRPPEGVDDDVREADRGHRQVGGGQGRRGRGDQVDRAEGQAGQQQPPGRRRLAGGAEQRARDRARARAPPSGSRRPPRRWRTCPGPAGAAPPGSSARRARSPRSAAASRGARAWRGRSAGRRGRRPCRTRGPRPAAGRPGRCAAGR